MGSPGFTVDRAQHSLGHSIRTNADWSMAGVRLQRVHQDAAAC